jgi:hypothetical protein
MHLHYVNFHAFPFDVKIASHENVYVYLFTWWLLSILLQWDESQKYHTVETVPKSNRKIKKENQNFLSSNKVILSVSTNWLFAFDLTKWYYQYQQTDYFSSDLTKWYCQYQQTDFFPLISPSDIVSINNWLFSFDLTKWYYQYQQTDFFPLISPSDIISMNKLTFFPLRDQRQKVSLLILTISLCEMKGKKSVCWYWQYHLVRSKEKCPNYR